MPVNAGPVSTGPVFAGTDLTCVRGARVVFSGLSFEVGGGEVLLLEGRNGSGKTSLLRLMAGLAPAFGGVLAWNGLAIDADLEGHRQSLIYVGHGNGVKPALTPWETLRAWAALRGRGDAAERAERALDRFGLLALAEVPCRYLSAGQQRRLALARLVAAPAPLWLLDEPLNGLDTASVANFLALLAAHRERGGQVVLASHDPDVVAAPRRCRVDAYSAPADAYGTVDRDAGPDSDPPIDIDKADPAAGER